MKNLKKLFAKFLTSQLFFRLSFALWYFVLMTIFHWLCPIHWFQFTVIYILSMIGAKINYDGQERR